MHDAFGVIAHAALTVFTGTMTPTPEETVDPVLVTPGPAGFVVIALLSLAVVALVWDMMRRIRRGRVRADINEELDAQERADAEAAAQPPTEKPEGDTPPRA